VIRVGRAADNDVVLDYPMISEHHARILGSGRERVIEDLGSTNGTALGSPDRKITRSPLSPTDTVYFGSYPIPASRLLGGSLSLGGNAHVTLDFRGDSMVLGRDPGCDVPLDYPMVSWRHARLERAPGGAVVEDLGSTNGTFVNGQRISGRVTVGIGDRIGLGSYLFRLASLDRLEQRDYRGNVTIEARDVGIEVPGRRLVEAASLTLYPSELVGLMGPSGAGKTTLLNALNGYVRPTSGAVLFNGLDLYANYDQFRQHIGYVPQDDIMHRDLTVRQALEYTARLRLPSDQSEEEIQKRIDRVLGELKLADAAGVRIGSAERKGISGGQRKRVNLAMELLTDPFVLFLDEPTSGLSSEDALLVMSLLRKMADDGKTILITIHQPGRQAFQKMDSVVLVARDATPNVAPGNGSSPAGRVVYFGPAYPDAVHFFQTEGDKEPEPAPELLMRGLGQRTCADWVARYAASPIKRKYVDERAGTNPATPAQAAAPAVHRGAGVRQWWTLVCRSANLKKSDVVNTGILLAQAPIIALLVALVFGKQTRPAMTPDTWVQSSTATATLLFLLVVAALWFGCSNSAREIVAEWAIYHRERMINLKIPSYVFSKLTVLGGLCVVQCALLLGIAGGIADLRGNRLQMFGVLLLASLVGVAVGLVLSALARTSEVAISLVPLVLIPMVILGGMLQPVHEIEEPIRSLTHVMPSRWAFEGLLILEGSHPDRKLAPAPSPPADPSSDPAAPPATGAAPPAGDLDQRFFDERSELPAVVAVLGALLAVLTCATAWLLKSRDVH